MSPAVLIQAREMLDDAVCRRASAAAPGGAGAVYLQHSPVAWLLPQVLELVMRTHDQPVETLAPTIRRLLLEQTYANVGGDGADCAALDASLDDAVDLMLDVLRAVRKHAVGENAARDALRV
ncbi:hypothetical protein OT109_08025 [Phycisphaeraceae bacterium D3-23]